jgi:hypothetical protein
MKKLFWAVCCSLIAASASACPNLAGRYTLRGEDGFVSYTVRQNGCDRVAIDRKNNYLGKISAEPTHVFIPDGRTHGKGIPISRWVGDRLQIGQESACLLFIGFFRQSAHERRKDLPSVQRAV